MRCAAESGGTETWGASEDLAGVPRAVSLRDRKGAGLGADERTARERCDMLAGGGAAADEVL